MSRLNMECTFCGEKLLMDQYRLQSWFPKVTIYCDNDNCEVQPCTDHVNPSAAFADAKSWR